MKRILLSFGLAALVAAAAAAQSNKFVDGLLEEGAVDLGSAAYLALAGSGLLEADASPEASFGRLVELGWAPAGSSASDPATASAYSFALMKAFGLRGGVMYSLFPSPRYAFRELVWLGVLGPRDDPAAPVDGVQALSMLGRVSALGGDE